MKHRTEPSTDPYNRLHIAADRHTILEHCTVDLADTDPVACALEQVGVTAVMLRFASGETLHYSKRGVL